MGFWPMEEAARRPQPDLQSNLASAAGPAASFFHFQSKHFVVSVYKLRAESLALVCYLRRTQRKKEKNSNT